MKNIQFLLLTVAITSMLSYSYKTEKSITKIVAPIPSMEPIFETQNYTVSEGLEIKLPTSSQINIPPDAFVDKDGNIVTGKVDFKYRIMDNATDIWLTGLPMEQEVNGEKQYFKTAGTFEIRAYQQGKELQLASNKNIDITIASNDKDAAHELFYFDETSGVWESEGDTTPENNEEKKVLAKEIRKTKATVPAITIPLGEDYFILEKGMFLDVFLKKTGISEASIIEKNLQEYGLSSREIKGDGIIMFNDVPTLNDMIVWKNKTNAPIPKEGNHEVKHLGNNRYQMRIGYMIWKTSDGRLLNRPHKDSLHYDQHFERVGEKNYFDGEVEAVMTLNELLAKEPNIWENARTSALKILRAKEARHAKMKDILRSYQVNKMGIHNWDILLNKEGFEVMVDFNIPDLEENEYRKIYCFFNDNTSVITYSNTEKGIKIPDTKDIFLVSVVSPKQVAIVPKNQIKLSQLREKGQTKEVHSFDFQLADLRDKNKVDLLSLCGL